MKRRELAAIEIGLASMLVAASPGCSRPAPYGLTTRIETAPYLALPARADGQIPALLSQTGVFSDTPNRIANRGLIPYDLNVAFWSDGAEKSRWIAVPRGKIAFAASGEWRFPAGTVFVKNFDLQVDAANPAGKRRLETRLLVRDADGGVYGVVYKWRTDGSDADLLAGSETEAVPIKSATGEIRQQTWYYPSRQDCLTCHTANAGGVLGVKTRQLNRSYSYPSGVDDNELRAWNHLGLFAPAFKEDAMRDFSALAAADNPSRSLQDRARSYLDANCSHCHRPGGTVANFDARYDTPLAEQALIDGPVLIDQGIDKPRVIAPHDIWRSIAYMRVDTDGDWINSLPGSPVLAPPTVAPIGGTYSGPVQISMSSAEPGAEIRYTLDGSVPELSDLRYDKPIRLSAPAVLRARVFKQGFTRSITVQEVFVIGK
jgi:uncharacterized repeat protein (TIGR03806 family)